MWYSSIILSVVGQKPVNADVAELADAQDLKSCGLILRAGSIPAICTSKRVEIIKFYSLIFYFRKSYNGMSLMKLNYLIDEKYTFKFKGKSTNSAEYIN